MLPPEYIDAVAIHPHRLVPLIALPVYLAQIAQRHHNIGMIRRQHPLFDPQSSRVTLQRIVQPLPLEVKIPHPVQEHGDLGVILPQRRLSCAQARLVQLPRAVELSLLLVYLRYARQDHSDVPVAMAEFSQRHPQELSIELGRPPDHSLLMIALPGVECRGRIIQAVRAERLPPYVQCVLVPSEGGVELVELHVYTAYVVEDGGDVYVSRTQGGGADGESAKEEVHGLAGGATLDILLGLSWVSWQVLVVIIIAVIATVVHIHVAAADIRVVSFLCIVVAVITF
mmetsp:Transcript_5063/g.12688  ORF Transcript_5063/g.12688 Transcript_5063/m.12688 type:complete len:284 (-) Transcript_5063:1946-2797(-)